MGTFFATHEAELYHYGRKGMRRGQHLPDVLDPKRELVGKRATTSNVALTSRLYDRYRTGKATREDTRRIKTMLGNYLPTKPTAVEAAKARKNASIQTARTEAMLRKAIPKKTVTKTNPSNNNFSKVAGYANVFEVGRAKPVSKRTRIGSDIGERTRKDQELAGMIAYDNSNKARKANSNKNASTSKKPEVQGPMMPRSERNRRLANYKMSTLGASSTQSRSADENKRTERAVNAQKQRVARAAERYNSNLGNVSGGAQQARKKVEDARTQTSRTKKLQKEARETRTNVSEIRRIRDYNARVARPKYLSKKAQAGAAEAISTNERRRTEDSKNQFSKMPKWKQNLERAKSQKAASENAEHVRRKKQYTDSQRRRHLEENRGRKSKRPY